MSGINGGSGGSGTDINGDPTGGGLTPAQQQTLDDIEEKTLYQSTTTPPDTTNFDGALTLNGVPVGGGGGNPFDQNLNTFDSPQFVSLELENNILFRDPTSGSEMILVSDNGLHKIETSGGTSGNNDLTIETDELRFEANGNLITQVAGNLSENIAANKTVQINANKIETITAAHQITAASHLFNGPITFNSQITGGIINCNTLQSGTQLTFGASSNIQILSPIININAPSITTNSRITTTQTSFTNPQEYITKDYVDNAIPLPPTLQDAYNLGNTIFTSASPGPVSILGTQGLEVNSNAVITAKTNFTDPNELVSKTYVDNSISAIGLQDAYTNGNTITTAPGFPIFLLGAAGLRVNSNAVITTKTTFTDPNEFVSKSYVDAGGGGSAYELIFAITNQISNIISIGTKFQIRAPRDFTISKIKLSLNTTAGPNFSVTILKNGSTVSSVFLNSLVQDTTITASFLENDIISVDVSNVGTGTASGLICYLLE